MTSAVLDSFLTALRTALRCCCHNTIPDRSFLAGHVFEVLPGIPIAATAKILTAVLLIVFLYGEIASAKFSPIPTTASLDFALARSVSARPSSLPKSIE